MNITNEIMRTITLQDIKTNGAKAIPDDGVVYLIVNSKPKSVCVPFHEYESLVEAVEELEDIKAIEMRHGETEMSLEDAFSTAA